MSTILGSGEHRYRVVENWAKLPDGWSLSDVASVAVDSKDRIYVFNRGAHPMVVLDRDGNFITSWGEGLFNRAHGLHIDADGNLYVAGSLGGKRGIVKITPDKQASVEIAGQGLVGLAFAPGRSAVLATTSGIHHLAWNIQGKPLISAD